ncbi:hypothetical protein BASA62_000174 [Batrachochytrium salamandrivorans]|nr:hypothetical protein BASA62_000174 [Batrachochytrium salamandrivorans]
MLSGGARRILRESSTADSTLQGDGCSVALSGLQAVGAATSLTGAPSGKQTVKVVIRVRPSLPHEKDSEACITTSSSEICIINPRNTSEQLKYTFDRVFGASDSQESVFAEVEPVIMGVFSGINTTIFAYGQTGSGKTHTINGSLPESNGIIPRTIFSLLSHIKEKGLKATLSAAYLEIYNEKIFDLLAPGDSKPLQNLDLRENIKGNIIVVGLSSTPIRSFADFEKLHEAALKNRSTAATNLNETSSRSHFIMQLSINNTLENNKVLSSKFHIIDLAGSEDNKRTGNVGARMVESGAINKSLFVLGQVVEALNKGQPRIPYRDSKITRLLQDSLGGSAVGLMIACCAPGEQHYWDTYNTLNFASKSSFIKNNVVRNEVTIKPSSPLLQNHGNGVPATTAEMSTSMSRKQELAEWKLRTKATSQSHGANVKGTRHLRLSNASTASDMSDRSYVAPSQLDELVNKKVETQINAHLATIRAEFLGKNAQVLTKTTKTSLCTTWRNELVVEAEKAVSQGRLADATIALKRAAALEGPDSSNREALIVQIARIEELYREEEYERSQSAAKIHASSDASKPSIEQLKHDTEKAILYAVNHGSLKEIMRLKQIGKKRAEAILIARDLHGLFTCTEDLSRAGMSDTLIANVFQSNLQL